MPIPDALMFKDADDESEAWDVIRIPAGRIPLLEAQGWSVLISSVPRDHDIRDTYAADLNRFNSPRRRG